MGGARLSAVVLGTCATLRLAGGRSPRSETGRAHDAVLLFPISARGIATKHGRRPEEVGLREPPEALFAAFAAQIGVRLAGPGAALPMRPTRLDLPDTDPADRLIVATPPAAGARVAAGDRLVPDHLDDALAH